MQRHGIVRFFKHAVFELFNGMIVKDARQRIQGKADGKAQYTYP
jgi:hypothetical protein